MIQYYKPVTSHSYISALLWQLLVTMTNNHTSNKSLSRILSRDYKRTRQEVPAVLLSYIYYYMMVHTITTLLLCILPSSPCIIHKYTIYIPYSSNVVNMLLDIIVQTFLAHRFFQALLDCSRLYNVMSCDFQVMCLLSISLQTNKIMFSTNI